MGWSPDQVAASSLWKFMAAADGWAEAHCADDENSLSSQEADDLWEWLNDGN